MDAAPELFLSLCFWMNPNTVRKKGSYSYIEKLIALGKLLLLVYLGSQSSLDFLLD